VPQALAPLATIRLSGATASSLAEARGSLWVTHYDSSAVSRVDPRAEREAGTVAVGAHAASITAIGGRLWIGHYTTRPQDSRLSLLDPARSQVVRRVQPPNLCCEVAGGAGKVWAVDPRGSLLRIDPASGRVVGRTSVSLERNVHVGLVGDDRGVWVSSDTTPLQKVDPRSGRLLGRIDVGGGIPMELSRGLVWGAGPHHVWAVQASSGAIQTRIPVENTIETLSLAVTSDAIWLAARRPGYVGVVLRLDRSTGALTGETPVSLPARVLYALGDIWVVDWDTNTLLRFDP
jgi:streptogramin lyase